MAHCTWQMANHSGLFRPISTLPCFHWPLANQHSSLFSLATGQSALFPVFTGHWPISTLPCFHWPLATGNRPLATAYHLTKNVCGITLTTFGQIRAAFWMTGLPLASSNVFASSFWLTYTVMDR